MTREEWESLCDGCARCCLYKLEDEETGEIYYTNVVCRLLDTYRCRCTAYPRRAKLMPTCLVLTPDTGPPAALDAKNLRLPSDRGGQRPGMVAPAGFRRPEYGAPGGNFGALADAGRIRRGYGQPGR